MVDIRIEITGLDKLQAALEHFPAEAQRHLEAAGKEAGEEVLNTEGLRKYPPFGPANQAPTPWYERGRGMWRGGIRKPEYNDGKSERLGSQWFVTTEQTTTTIGNRASYAGWVHGERQAQAMGQEGWRKLGDVAQDKIGKIAAIYQGWVDRLADRLFG